jgi:NADPH-dependent glutamate synthase beta subunit-like oxidoreductase
MIHPGHYVAIFGGAVSGAEAAYQLSQRGIRVVVFDQQTLPYGKIEDGLPKWHVKLRDKEEGNINEKLSNEFVEFVPNVRLGRDISFEEVVKQWGFSAVIMATGAWRDRPLPVEGIDDYIGNGFYYQNSFINWFNHCHEPDYSGIQYEIEDGALVIGGGLASIDVVKVLMMENVRKALEEKGHKTDIFKMDRGINKVLDELGYTLEDLGVKGCTLFYRRRGMDMPLSPAETNTPELLEKAQTVRAKILNTFQTRFLFDVKELHSPIETIVEDGRLVGMVFQENKMEDGKAVPVEGSRIEYRGPLTISSIGSIPEPIDGVPSDGQVFRVADSNLCRIDGYDNVFAVGNAVTGRGNINESLKHGREISQNIMDDYLDWQEEDFQELLRQREASVAEQMNDLSGYLADKEVLPVEKIEAIQNRIAGYQEEAGYNGNFMKWVDQHLPKRLEDMLEGVSH